MYNQIAYLATPTSTPVPAGRIEGYIAADNVPAHQQFGDVGMRWYVRLFSVANLCATVSIKPGRQYLVVKVESASRLRAADESGFSDPFVVVSWNGVRQETKVRNLLFFCLFCLFNIIGGASGGV